MRAVESMVPSRSSSSAAPSRAKRRRRRSASLMLRVPSSTVSSRLRYSRASQTLTALRLPRRAADADAFGVVAVVAEGRGAAGADPLVAALVPRLAAPRAARAASRISLSQPPSASMLRLLLLAEQRARMSPAAASRPGISVASSASNALLRALEVRGEHAVEAVEVPLVLHQRRAREVVEVFRRRAGDAAPRAPRAASGTR